MAKPGQPVLPVRKSAVQLTNAQWIEQRDHTAAGRLENWEEKEEFQSDTRILLRFIGFTAITLAVAHIVLFPLGKIVGVFAREAKVDEFLVFFYVFPQIIFDCFDVVIGFLFDDFNVLCLCFIEGVQ